MREWQTNGSISVAHLQAISDGVTGHGRALSFVRGGDGQPVACALMDDGTSIAGAMGRTEFRRLFISYLWVDAQWRGMGLGAEALHRLEALALERGCTQTLIESLDDAVADWYVRCGYQRVACLVEYCGPWSRHTLLKPLSTVNHR